MRDTMVGISGPTSMSDEDVRGLDAHIPYDRRVALARGEKFPDRTSGAALFADISGFTRLADELSSRLGPQRGAEELTTRLNGAMRDVIGEVHRFGGSVIGFPGDGVTCWFDGDDGRRATGAALAVHERRQHEGGDAALGLKLGVTAGLARRFLVGHPRIHRMDVVAGALVDRMAIAEKLARSGEVLIGSEIVGWIRDLIDIVEWRQDRPDGESPSGSRETPEGEWFAVISGTDEKIARPPDPLPAPAVPVEVARDWVIPAVHQRLLRGRGTVLSEIRQVVTLFNHFGGIRYDLDNDAGEKLDRYIRWTQTVLARYEAFLLQLTVGDKGSYFYAAFGAPLSHEDDADRAVKAAAELREPPDDLRFVAPPRIGISQGKMLAGAYGAPARKTYGVLGRAANVAARLMEHATPSEVLVDRTVAELASPRYVFTDSSHDDAVRLVEEQKIPEAPALGGVRSIGMLGRTEERRRVTQALGRLLDGHAQFMLVDGPAGIGKSRLLAVLKREAERLGIPVYVGGGSAIERNTPFYAWRSIFRRVLDLEADADAAAARAAVENVLGDEPQLLELAPLLNPVLLVNLPETTTTAQMPPSVRSENALDVLVACLARRSVSLEIAVLLIDDAHWLDSASRALIERVRATLPQLFVAVGMRPLDTVGDGEGPSELRRLVKEHPDMHLSLERLSDEEIGDLAARVLGVDEIPTPLFDVLAERSEGNPFFAQELVQALQDRNLIGVESGRVQVSGTIDQLREEFPQGIERLLTSRLDHLALQQQSVLLVASIVGGTFTASMLRDVAPPDLELRDVDETLDALVESDMLAAYEARPERRFEFRHGLIRQAAAELLTPSWKRQVHARAAAWIEEHHGDALTSWYSVLAHHWDGAEDTPRALHYLTLAAANAFATSAYEEAVRLYQRALELAGDDAETNPRERARLHLRLGEVYVHGQLEDATGGRRHLEEGLRLLGKRLPRNRVALLGGLLGQIAVHGLHRLGVRRSRQGEARREMLLDASRGYERLVEVYYISGESSLSLYAALRALNLAESAGPSSELARGLATVGAIFGFIPLHRVAERYLARALDMVDPDADPSAAAWNYLVAAFYQAGLGRWTASGELEGAEPLARRVVELSTRIGDSRRVEDGLSNLMFQAYLRGDFETALELSDRLREMAEARGATRPLAYALQGRSYCLLDVGRIAGARRAVQELDGLLADDPRFADQALTDDATGLLILVESRAGRTQRAVQLAESLLVRIAGRAPSNFSALAAYTAPPEALLVDWRTRGLRRDLAKRTRTALRALRRYARLFPIGRPRLLLWKAVYAGLHGKDGEARRLLDESARLASELALPVEEARALGELADTLGRDSEAGVEKRAEAEKILRDLGISPELEDTAGLRTP